MAIFEVIVAVGAILLLLFVYLTLARTSITRINLIPGPKPADKEKGNLDEIKALGSVHVFLEKYHKKYGPIISFWYGPTMFVSIASWKLFQEHTAPFDRPVEAYEFLVPLLSRDNFVVANGDSARRRHAAYSKAFSHSSVNRFVTVFNKVGKGMVERWLNWRQGKHILLQEEMFHLTISSILISMFGEDFENEELVAKVKAAFGVCYGEVEKRFLFGEGLVPGSAIEAEFQIKKKFLYDLILGIILGRRELLHSTEEKLPIDAVLELGLTESEAVSDILTLIIGGFHTTATTLMWCIYFLATHQEVQNRVRTELSDIFGNSDQLTTEMVGQLTYLQHVLKETLRVARIGPIAARVYHSDIFLGGYTVLAETPIIQELGVSFHDETVFPEPQKFDPDRFSPENEKVLPPFSFEPFGFAGKRKCPGYNFSFIEATVCLSLLLRSVKVELAKDQVAEPQFGLVSKIKNDMWVIASPL